VVREIRAPLATGYARSVAIWLVVADRVPRDTEHAGAGSVADIFGRLWETPSVEFEFASAGGPSSGHDQESTAQPNRSIPCGRSGLRRNLRTGYDDGPAPGLRLPVSVSRAHGEDPIWLLRLRSSGR
jgi:hypothetical protein